MHTIAGRQRRRDKQGRAYKCPWLTRRCRAGRPRAIHGNDCLNLNIDGRLTRKADVGRIYYFTSALVDELCTTDWMVKDSFEEDVGFAGAGDVANRVYIGMATKNFTCCEARG
jgi:hypothetical protein